VIRCNLEGAFLSLFTAVIFDDRHLRDSFAGEIHQLPRTAQSIIADRCHSLAAGEGHDRICACIGWGNRIVGRVLALMGR